MSYKIEEIEGIGPANAAKLSEASIATVEQLLDSCADAKGREAVAEKTGFSTSQILKWANMADLMRIGGIAGEYAELLKASGVDTVKELRTRRPDNLTAKMTEINGEKNLTRKVPAESMVMKWIEEAKNTEPKITH